MPRITFGIIVLNGEPFVRYNLRALYRFAHEIIVVEGACRAAAAVATPDGHSTDGTLEDLYRFKAEEDAQDKVHIITRNGFWDEKDEQSQAYAERATGDYLWQVDIDEFYQPEDMCTIMEMLGNDPEVTAVSFKQITFWCGFDYLVDGWYLRQGAEIFHRLFKWGPGYRYVKHRPPTVRDPQGQDLRQLKWVSGYELARRGIYMYHYSLLFPKQVLDKCNYYSRSEWATHASAAQQWAEENFLRLQNPFRVHNVYQKPSWIERFHGFHPLAVQELIADIKAGKIMVEVRRSDDVEKLLHSFRYRMGRFVLQAVGPIASLIQVQIRRVKRAIRGVLRRGERILGIGDHRHRS